MFLSQLTTTTEVPSKDCWPEVKSSPEKTKDKRPSTGSVTMVMERTPTLSKLPNYLREGVYQFTQ